MTTSAKKKKTKADLERELAEKNELIAQLQSQPRTSTNRPDFCLTLGELQGMSAPEIVKTCLEQQKLVTYGDAADTLGIEKRNGKNDDGVWVNWSMEVCNAFEAVLEGSSALLCNAKGGYGKKKLVESHNQWLREHNIPHEVTFTPPRQSAKKQKAEPQSVVCIDGKYYQVVG